MRGPPESTCSIGGHLIARHHLGNVLIGNDTVVTSGVAVLHEGLEVLARGTNLVGLALPQDGHYVRGNPELAGALRDYAVKYGTSFLAAEGGHHGVLGGSGSGSGRLC